MDSQGTAPSAESDLNISQADLLSLSLVQLHDIIAAVEQHGVELGMLTSVLLDLIERHQAAAEPSLPDPRSDPGPPPGPDPAAREGESMETLLRQLAADHRTMLSFNGPLYMLQQFYDRLRQRLEHLDQALRLLPHQTAMSPEALTKAPSLFPLPEERAALADLAGLRPDGDQEPGIEIF